MKKTRSSDDRRPRRSQSTKYMFIRNETIRCRTRCIMCRLSFHDAEMLIDTYPELLPKLTEAHAAQVQFMQGSKRKLASDLVSSLRTAVPAATAAADAAAVAALLSCCFGVIVEDRSPNRSCCC